MTPLSLVFGPWTPDLQNVATEVPAGFVGPLTVPCSDVLNVYYQDGAYRCIPSPVGIGPALGSQVLAAFTQYDNTAGQEIVFGATATGISALIDGAWTSIPVVNAVSVFISSWKLASIWGSFVFATPWQLTSAMGSITVSGQLFNGTLTAASLSGGNGDGYSSGVGGSITPSSDLNGHVITQMLDVGPALTFILVFNAPNLGQSYFTQLVFPSLSKTFTSSSATYTTDGSTFSKWTWSSLAGLGVGNYAVNIT